MIGTDPRTGQSCLPCVAEGDSSDDGGGQLHVLIQAGELQSEQGSSRQSRHIGLDLSFITKWVWSRLDLKVGCAAVCRKVEMKPALALNLGVCSPRPP